MHTVTVAVLAIAAVTTIWLGLYVLVYLPRTMQRQLKEALGAFATAVELRFPSHRGLSARVVTLSRAVGQEIGLGKAQLANLEMAASLRDIGLCAVPYSLVNERHPRAWTADEASHYERHGEVSGAMLQDIPRLSHLAPVVSNHHVDFDSAAKLDIPIPQEAFILNAVTAYLWAERIQGALVARGALIDGSGTTYEPKVVEALLRVLPSQRAGVTETDHLVRT